MTLKPLPYVQVRLQMRSLQPVRLPGYHGSMLRGGLGSAFRQLACMEPGNSCEGCMFLTQCVYAYVFETPQQSIGGKVGHQRAPHPFLLRPSLSPKEIWDKGDVLEFDLLLFGQGVPYLPYFIRAFQIAGRRGFGAARGRFELERVLQLGETQQGLWEAGRMQNQVEAELLYFPEIPWEVPTATLRFITPLRLMEKGRRVTRVSFEVLVRALFRRIDLISRAHGEGPLDLSFQEWLIQAQGVLIKKQHLEWQEWSRYSNRQQRKIGMGGLVGEVTFIGRLAPFVPLLRWGEVLHLGKGTVFGLGQYKLIFPINKGKNGFIVE